MLPDDDLATVLLDAREHEDSLIEVGTVSRPLHAMRYQACFPNERAESGSSATRKQPCRMKLRKWLVAPAKRGFEQVPTEEVNPGNLPRCRLCGND
jgi:hypothetical protein